MSHFKKHKAISFSLPTQRCFRLCQGSQSPRLLFSAYAEVFPIRNDKQRKKRPFLCLRRGVSDSIIGSNRSADFSLPTQRCFSLRARLLSRVRLFSAYAEVFPDAITTAQTTAAFLCLRRGVSPPLHRPGCPGTFSLPTQRCFTLLGESAGLLGLFSAYAEVFPTASRLSERKAAFLCLRRGVSWRRTIYPNRRPLFSAYAEVFPCFLVSWVP